MRRKIFWFHMVTIILALLSLLAVSGGVLNLVFRLYRESAVPAADSRLEQVQDILSGWPEDACDWQELDRQLAQLDYQLVVDWDHQVFYSSLSGLQWEIYDRAAADAFWPEGGTLVIQDQGIFIVGRIRIIVATPKEG